MTRSGKTTFWYRVLHERLITPFPESILWYFGAAQVCVSNLLFSDPHTVELLPLLIADTAYTATHQYPRHPTAPWLAGVRVDGILDKCAQYSHHYRRSRPGFNRKGQWTE